MTQAVNSAAALLCTNFKLRLSYVHAVPQLLLRMKTNYDSHMPKLIEVTSEAPFEVDLGA